MVGSAICRALKKKGYENLLTIEDVSVSGGVIQTLKTEDKRILICPIHEYWIDIGRRETLKEAYESWIN